MKLNTTSASGENPSEIGDKLSTATNTPANRRNISQQDRLANVLTTFSSLESKLEAHPAARDSRSGKRFVRLQGCLARAQDEKDTRKRRVKIVKLEKRIHDNLKEVEAFIANPVEPAAVAPTPATPPVATPAPVVAKPPASVVAPGKPPVSKAPKKRTSARKPTVPVAVKFEELLQIAERIEGKIQFAKEQNLTLQAEEAYRNTIPRLTSLKEEKDPAAQRKAINGILKEMAQIENNLNQEIEASQPTSPASSKTMIQEFVEYWFYLKLHLLIYLLLPEKEWPKATAQLREAAASGVYPKEGSDHLIRAADELDKTFQDRATKRQNRKNRRLKKTEEAKASPPAPAAETISPTP